MGGIGIGIGLGLIPTAARPAATTAPVNVVKPSFDGPLTQGQVSNVNPGSWTGLPSPNFTYSIKRSGVQVSTSPTYVWASADVAAGAGAMTVEVTATNDIGPTTQASDPVTIAAPLTLTGSAPTAYVGLAYNFSPTRAGGHGPYTFSLTGTLPSGLSFSTSTGAITGTPVASGTASLNISVTDADGLTASLGTFNLVVSTAASYEGLIATRCRSLTSFISGNKQISSQTAHVAADDIHSLKIAIANFRLTDSASNEQGSGGTMTVTASVVYAGVYTQIKFSGSATGTVASGGLLFSDYTAGDLGIPAGATFFIRIFNQNPSGILYNAWRNSSMGELTAVAASGLTDVTMGGTITSSGNFSAPPFAIIGTTTKPAVCVIGDSKGHGYLDTAESAAASGPGLRGEVCKSFPASLPFLNMSSAGWRANLWASQGVSRKLMLPYFSHYVLQLGRNDLVVSGASAATLKASNEAIIADIKTANANAKVTVTCPGPTSTSTSGDWLSDADQTTSGTNATRVAYCNIVRASGLTGQNNGFFELARPLESANDNGLWKSDGTPDKYSPDGVHESPAGYDLIVAAGSVDLTKFAYP